MPRSRCLIVLIAGLLLLCLLVSVPAWLLQTNPPVVQEPPWDSPQTRALAQRACFDCHSDQTSWPWFTKIPPGSWLAALDTVCGRRALNFSEWSARQARRAREVPRQIESGEMPPGTYTLMHPNAVLSPPEQQQLIQGLQASMK